jgi:hypothetical protein
VDVLTGNDAVAATSVSFFNVKQVAPGAVTANGMGVSASTSIASEIGGVVVDALATVGSAGTLLAGPGQMTIGNFSTGSSGTDAYIGASYKQALLATNMSWTLGTVQYWGLVAANLVPQ